MSACRETVNLPLWASDEMDASVPVCFEPPYFDTALRAWVLVRYEDVNAALRSDALTISGTEEQEAARGRMRAETLGALSGEQLRAWMDGFRPMVRQRVGALPEGVVFDLVGEYLRPVCVDLAVLVTGIAPSDVGRLDELARAVSDAAAEPCDAALKARAKEVMPALEVAFHSEVETLRESGFVGLAYTLAAMLANGCYALLREESQWGALHRDSVGMERAVEELMRYAGVTRVLRRWAVRDVELGEVLIRGGDGLILRVLAANHDSQRFYEAERLDVQRKDVGHLTLGAGPHACAGASLLRMASTMIFRMLVERFGVATLMMPVMWRGGSGFRTPRELKVRLGRGVGLARGGVDGEGAREVRREDCQAGKDDDGSGEPEAADVVPGGDGLEDAGCDEGKCNRV
jgi:cytochrome P450